MIVIANVYPKLETLKILFRPLSKKRRFGTRFDSQHLKTSQILAKSPWERLCHVVSWFPGKLISKVFPQVLGDVLVECVNKLTVHGKCPVQDCANLQLTIQM